MADSATNNAAEIERRRARARLVYAKRKLGELEVRLEALHADRSGAAELVYKPPLIPDEYYSVGRCLARVDREAAAGCELAAAWMQETAEQRAHIDHLRATPLAKRAPDYDGPRLMPSHATRMGKPPRHRPGCYRRRPGEELAAEHLAKIAERESERKARGEALRREFLREVEEARAAKAGAHVPH